MSILPDGNIQLNMIRDLDSFDYDNPVIFGFDGKLVSRTIDSETGVVLEETVEGYEEGEFQPQRHTLVSRPIKNSNGDLLQLFTNPDGEVVIYDIEKSTMNIADSAIFTSYYNLEDDQLTSSKPRTLTLGSDALITVYNAFDSNYLEADLKFVWTDISDKNNIHDYKSKDVSNYLYLPQKYETHQCFIMSLMTISFCFKEFLHSHKDQNHTIGLYGLIRKVKNNHLLKNLKMRKKEKSIDIW